MIFKIILIIIKLYCYIVPCVPPLFLFFTWFCSFCYCISFQSLSQVLLLQKVEPALHHYSVYGRYWLCTVTDTIWGVIFHLVMFICLCRKKWRAFWRGRWTSLHKNSSTWNLKTLQLIWRRPQYEIGNLLRWGKICN